MGLRIVGLVRFFGFIFRLCLIFRFFGVVGNRFVFDRCWRMFVLVFILFLEELLLRGL